MAAFIASTWACGGSLDVGWNEPHGLLPVDERNPIVISNDSDVDNWQGEYALLVAHSLGARLQGIIVCSGTPWPDVDVNTENWAALLDAARASGLSDVPDTTTSVGKPLVRPDDGTIDATNPNRSEGARLIVDLAARVSRPNRPLVVATGSRLTDVADAYLLDPTITERVVVVSSLGTVSSSGATMGVPNGEMDTWADTIVAHRFRYVQVNAYYDQTLDVPSSRATELPNNAFGNWMAKKQVWSDNYATDQIGVLAVWLPSFVLEVKRMSPNAVGADSPTLQPDPQGNVWVVTRGDIDLSRAQLWKWLLDPNTFAP